MWLRRLFIGLFLGSQAHGADVALVDDELGQALLMSNRGLCYAVLPNHVSKDTDRIALVAPSPVAVGAAEIFWRDPENDLAVAYVEGALSERCTLEYTDLTSDLANVLLGAETGLIKSVHFDGAFFDRIGAVLIDVDDQFVTVRTTDVGIDADVMQGLSGAMLSVDGKIAGIAIDAEDTGEARFLRLDRITQLIGPVFGGADHPSARTIAPAPVGKGFRVTGYAGGDKAGVVGLEAETGTGPWISAWTGDPIEFEVTLSNDQVLALNSITMTTQVGEGFTPARRIEIQIDRGLPNTPYWKDLFTPDMSPTGVFEVSTGSTWARRVKIRILDVWSPDQNLRIDTLVFE